jgi:alkanesulfonate monooxygenase
VIARESEEDAWRVAHARFPEDRRGQITHQLAVKVSDSVWHRRLSRLAAPAATQRHPYWLAPFQNYQTFCPYLVGSHDRVAAELRRYLDQGCRTFILDVPVAPDDLEHIMAAFARARSATAP